ncbi:hypothetical protein ACJIZ3_015433 [Penstemon smallii]|uniref:NAD(P)-binding domain-containing protein n=1 Tax=Penstemon smallii TaxID=265156 RepID=A0ABD3RMM1_9LAMI
MELRCIQYPTVSSIPRSGFLHGHTIIKLPTVTVKKNFPHGRKIKLLDFRAKSSGIATMDWLRVLMIFGTTRIKSQAQAQDDATPSDFGTKDGNLVFVAGATGKVGSRTVRELLKLGFKVRAGVRSKQRAESLVQSVRKMKLEDVAEGTQPIDKLELVECDLEKQNQIGPAIGNSSIVICCIGASEKEIFDITGPYRIDYQATKNLIDAATSAKVDHFILLTSLGTNKVGFPAAILNLFWGVLIWKRKAEEALLASGLPYTIVRPGGMERPTDSYKETHNITLSEEDTLFGGQVSNLQVAELMAFMAKNRSLSYCKVVEVVAETSAPLIPMGDLLKNIPSGREQVFPSKETDNADGSKQVPSSTYVEKEPEKAEATAETPLSPYTCYEDLKPPTSPTPTPSIGSGTTKDSKIEITPDETSSISEVNSLETLTIAIDNVTPQIEPKKQNPLSPYTNYEDLKPPSSPIPTPSTGSGATIVSKTEITPTATSSASSSTEDNSLEIPDIGSDATKASKIEITADATISTSSSVEVNSLETSTFDIDNGTPQITPKKQNPSSPYTNYEDLKPPSSPTPTPSGLKKEPSVVCTSEEEASPFTGGNELAKSDTTSELGEDPTETSDLKPPSFPSIDEKSGDINQHTESKARPLSPYTMYEDMKPPSSPVPSPKKL